MGLIIFILIIAIIIRISIHSNKYSNTSSPTSCCDCNSCPFPKCERIRFDLPEESIND